MSDRKKVLMVCLGNTCRSPIAEAVFRNHAKEIGCLWDVDSAALKGYHVGERPNQRTLYILAKNNIIDYDHLARVIQNQDFNDFDWILGMDEYNIHLLNKLKPQKCRAQVELLGKYHPNGQIIIQDPYMSNDISSFQSVYEQCVECIDSFLKKNS